MIDPLLTVPEAARMLETSEHMVRKAIQQGRLPIAERRGGYARGKIYLRRSDVQLYAKQRGYGDLVDRLKTVVVLDPLHGADEILDDARLALQASGLHVRVAHSAMDAFSLHEAQGERPVIIVRRELMPVGEVCHNLLSALSAKLHLIIIGPIPVIPTGLDEHHWLVEEHDLRSLVRAAWAHIDRRK